MGQLPLTRGLPQFSCRPVWEPRTPTPDEAVDRGPVLGEGGVELPLLLGGAETQLSGRARVRCSPSKKNGLEIKNEEFDFKFTIKNWENWEIKKGER